MEIKKTYFIGIDPGKKGAIARINIISGISEVIDMPLTPMEEIDSYFIYKLFRSSILACKKEEIICIIEKQQSMPKQGVASTFTTGKGYGKLLSALEISEMPFKAVPPRTWKKYFGLNSNKQSSIDIAMILYPELEFYGPRGGLKDGRAEAILMAEYGKQMEK